MIQRIQSLYLLAASVILLPLFFQPLANIQLSENLFLQFFHNRITGSDQEFFSTTETLPVTILLSVLIAISLFAIFQYKNRVRQIRLCIFNIILHFGLVGLIYFYTKYTLSQHNGIQSAFLWPVMLIFISIIFNYMAIKMIQKDELLIKSIDRLRR